MQIFRAFTACVKINQIPCVIFQAISFSTIFASTFCIMTDNFSEIFHLQHYMLCTKRAYQRTIFLNFESSNESSPDSSCHFCTRLQGQGLFMELFSVMKYDSSEFFSSKKE